MFSPGSYGLLRALASPCRHGRWDGQKSPVRDADPISVVPLRLLILITKRKRGKKKKRGKRTPNPEDLLVVLGQLLCTESSPAVPARDAAAASSMAVRPSCRCCVLPVEQGCAPGGNHRGALELPLRPAQLRTYLVLTYPESNSIGSCSRRKLHSTWKKMAQNNFP